MKKNRNLRRHTKMCVVWKIFLTMKLTLLLVLLGLMQVSASVYSQNSKLSLDLKNCTIKQALQQIEDQSEFRFFYNEQFIDLDRRISVNLENKSVENILEEVFRGADISYKIMANNLIIITPNKEGNIQQNRTVSGKLTDESGNPMPGVTVVVKGSTVGTITDTGGKYSLTNVPPDAILVFSFVGMKTQEIPVVGKSVINVALQEETIGIEEVVAIGYGVQRKEAVTGSVASVGGDELRNVPSSDISQALQGRISGVQLSQTDSKPGATMQIRIRGSRSLNASNDPLIVLDNVPFAGSISDIDPNNIKSVDILKDASATAIYGSRGANGVILITTDKGQMGQKPKITFNSYVGAKKVFAKYPMMNGPEYIKLRAIANKYTNGTDESDDVNTDWQDLLYRTGVVTSQDVNVAGGTDHGNYNFGVGYYKDEAVLPLQDYDRFSMHASLDQEIGKYFRFGFSSNSNYSISNGSSIGVGTALSTTPVANPYNEDGTMKRTVTMPADINWVYTKESLENLGDDYKNQTKAYSTYNNLYGEVKIPWVEGLKYRLNLGLDYRSSNGGSYTGVGVFSSDEDNESSASISNSLTTHWMIENLLTYDRTFSEKAPVKHTRAVFCRTDQLQQFVHLCNGCPLAVFSTITLGRSEGDITINPNYQDYYEKGLMSWMGRIMYSYNDRYMLMSSFRSDGSSVLAEGHKWHSYPAISAGWNINKEPFMQNIPGIDMLKLRVGYGENREPSH